MSKLPPLPAQRQGVPWPTRSWPEASLDSRPGVEADVVRDESSRLIAPAAGPRTGETHALVVVHRGELVHEAYGAGHGADETLISWSMAKSILHAAFGVLVRDQGVDVHAPAPVPRWQGEGDPRARITTEDLLRMVDGLAFVEDYVDSEVSSVIEMLFGRGKDDVAGYAESVPAGVPPGTRWNYSSGTSNVLAGIAGRAVGGGRAGMEAFLRRELFDRLGMTSATPRFDAAGTFIASSFVYATARDFARFGLLYLRDGVWEDERVLPEGWVDHARTPTPASRGEYGAHFWLAMNGSGVFHCSGYQGQYIAIDPVRDVVIVRLGKSEREQRGAVYTGLDRIGRAFPRRDEAAA